MKKQYASIKKEQLMDILSKAKRVGDTSEQISAQELVDFIQHQLLWVMDNKK
ncbi:MULTISPECIES: hypothetical protein [Bacillus]|uniref:hypothetical protein n=1 Tax=Bacillus TaxID=1386 RepID=UPI0012FEEF18|nr:MULTISPECIES: hypothetical protein [Bacillus]